MSKIKILKQSLSASILFGGEGGDVEFVGLHFGNERWHEAKE